METEPTQKNHQYIILSIHEIRSALFPKKTKQKKKLFSCIFFEIIYCVF